MGKVRDSLIQKLQSALNPEFLDVKDESAKHAGHAEAGEETHFQITIKAAGLDGLSRIAAHQRIYSIIDEEIKTSVHALSIKLK